MHSLGNNKQKPLRSIPFRKGKTLGIVLEKTKSSSIRELKTILGPYADLHFSEDGLALSQWLAKQTFTSLPSIWKSWLRDYPKKPKTTNVRYPTKRKKTEIDLLEQMVLSVQQKVFLSLHQ